MICIGEQLKLKDERIAGLEKTLKDFHCVFAVKSSQLREKSKKKCKQLQDKMATFKERCHQLELDVIDAREKERKLKEQCVALEGKLAEQEEKVAYFITKCVNGDNQNNAESDENEENDENDVIVLNKDDEDKNKNNGNNNGNGNLRAVALLPAHNFSRIPNLPYLPQLPRLQQLSNVPQFPYSPQPYLPLFPYLTPPPFVPPPLPYPPMMPRNGFFPNPISYQAGYDRYHPYRQV